MLDRSSLAEVAERIASTENRQNKLRIRLQRLKEEGSDASQEEEVLALLGKNLAQLYRAQAAMRRSSWTATRAA